MQVDIGVHLREYEGAENERNRGRYTHEGRLALKCKGTVMLNMNLLKLMVVLELYAVSTFILIGN